MRDGERALIIPVRNLRRMYREARYSLNTFQWSWSLWVKVMALHWILEQIGDYETIILAEIDEAEDEGKSEGTAPSGTGTNKGGKKLRLLHRVRGHRLCA